MIPIRDNRQDEGIPIVTWTLIALNCILFVWDRQGKVFAGNIVFSDLAMRPSEVVAAIRGAGNGFDIVKMFTSMFLHGNLIHLFGNLVFLLVFGHGVERAFGPLRYMIYFLFWGLMASAAHIFVNPESNAQVLGASGAIGGVLGCYFLLYPANKIEIWIPFLFSFVVVSAWVLLGIWFLYQILIPQNGVANWAHAGGFLAGMLTVLIAGGRQKILRGLSPEDADNNEA
ncbi:MAG: rhomboid family intramembrane serine protease [Fimbriimonadaceae bacterium]|nr:rhomboid family intramembrane serine protease [Fimbriimonadaceae bacterium]